MKYDMDIIAEKYLSITESATCDEYGQISKFDYRISVFVGDDEQTQKEFIEWINEQEVPFYIATYSNGHFTYKALSIVSHWMAGLNREARKKNVNVSRALNNF